MSEMQENELNDVVLCYQAMGIPLGASPAEIERIFRSLSLQYKRNIASPDPEVLQEAKRNLEHLNEIYGKIRNSVTYRAMEREQSKTGDGTSLKTLVRRPETLAVPAQKQTTTCPSCKGSIGKGLQSCPICRAPLDGAPRVRTASRFTPVKIAVYCAILAAGALAFYLYQTSQPPIDPLADLDAIAPRGVAK